MNRLNDTEVIIDNKRCMLTGYESVEYLHKIAEFINNKSAELKRQDAYKTLNSDMKNIFIQINIADEYFKLQRQLDDLEADNDSKCNEIYNLRHEIVDLTSKLEEANKELDKLRKEVIDEQKKNVKLETELSSERKTKSTKR